MLRQTKKVGKPDKSVEKSFQKSSLSYEHWGVCTVHYIYRTLEVFIVCSWTESHWLPIEIMITIITIIALSTYSSYILQRARQRNRLDVVVNRPVLMFWPTDDAIKGLPQDLMNRLLDPVNVLDLIRFIQYHVVTQVQVSVRRNLLSSLTIKALCISKFKISVI